MSFDPTWIFLSLIPSGIGFVLFMYGKKQDRWPLLVGGLILMVYPYFATSVLSLVSVGTLIGGGLWYAVLKASYHLSFAQVGLMTLTLMLTASLLQPLVGLYTDRHHTPYSLVIGMGFSLVGLLLLSVAGRLASLLLAAGLVGVGSSVFHPESSRVARMASGGRHGMAQSVFQVGGNMGSALGPLLAAFLVLPRGQLSIAWCSVVALLAMAVLWKIGGWHQGRRPMTVATQ